MRGIYHKKRNFVRMGSSGRVNFVSIALSLCIFLSHFDFAQIGSSLSLFCVHLLAVHFYHQQQISEKSSASVVSDEISRKSEKVNFIDYGKS